MDMAALPPTHPLGFLAGAGGGKWARGSANIPGLRPRLAIRFPGPASLRTSLRILLTTQHPVFIFWGAELICFYNDSYSRSLGPEKHPHILGQPGAHVLARNLVDHRPADRPGDARRGRHLARERAGAHHSSWRAAGCLLDLQLRTHRRAIRARWRRRRVVICTETTQQVLTERRIAAERERFAQLFEQAPTFMTVLRGPRHVFELANPRYLQLVGDRPIIGRPIAEALPEAVSQGYVERLDQVYSTGEAFSAIAAPYLHRTRGRDRYPLPGLRLPANQGRPGQRHRDFSSKALT